VRREKARMREKKEGMRKETARMREKEEGMR
jgi:hypothetical protein